MSKSRRCRVKVFSHPEFHRLNFVLPFSILSKDTIQKTFSILKTCDIFYFLMLPSLQVQRSAHDQQARHRADHAYRTLLDVAK